MLRLTCCLMVLVLLAGGLAGVPALPGNGENGAGPRGPATPDGLYWTNDTRLTSSSNCESQPALAVDGNGDSFVSWNRSGQLMLKKVNVYGEQLLAERQISPAFIPAQHTSQPTERMGVDDEDLLHIAWCARDSLYGPYYQKFASSGSPLCQPVDLSIMANDPHAISLGAGGNGRGYFAYESSSGQRIEMAYIDTGFNIHSGYLAGQGGRGVTIGMDRMDKPHVFWRDASSGDMDLRLVIFSSVGVLLQNVKTITSPQGISSPDAPMPAVAFGTDGAIHLLQASSLTGSRTLYYTKLAPDGTRLTPDIKLTTRAADFGDICLDRQNNVLLAWGDASDDEIYFATINSDKENDTIAPVKLTGSNGGSMSPSMAMDAAGRLHLVWVDGRDGTDRIYYKLRYSKGVELSMLSAETVKMASVHPNQTVSANVSLCNAGMLNDTAYLCITADFYDKPGGTGKNYSGDGWKVWMDDRYMMVNLSACETRNLSVSVRGPFTGSSNDYITVILTATSKLDPISKSILRIRVYLIVYREICLAAHTPIQTTPPEGLANYLINIENKGDVWETIDISAIGPPGWIWVLNLSEVRLGPGTNTEISLTVTWPDTTMGFEVGVVTVTGICRSAPSIKSQVSVHTVVSVTMALELLGDRDEAFADPGGTASFLLTVWNHGNMAGDVIFFLETLPVPPEWAVSLDPGVVGLEGEDSRDVFLNVTAPKDAPAGARLVVTVNCSNEEMTVLAELRFTVIVNPVHGLNVSTTPVIERMEPGGMAYTALNITSAGNTNENVTIGLFEMPAGWSVWFELPDETLLGENDSFFLGARLTARINAVITSPVDALAGTYRFSGIVHDGAGGSYPVSLAVQVDQRHMLEMNSTSPGQSGSPGRTVYFPLTVINLGNGPEQLQMVSSAMPVEWHAPFFLIENDILDGWQDINASQSLCMTVGVRVPDFTPLDTVGFNVSAMYRSGCCASLSLSISIQKADLVIIDFGFSPPVLKAGKRVNVNVTVANNGSVDAGGFRVAFLAGGEVQAAREFHKLEAGARAFFSFWWTPSKGMRILKFTVDPYETVCESNETNNSVALVRTPLEDPVTVQPVPVWSAVVTAAVIIIAIVAFAGIRKDRRP
jgi:uncharacterized membrane protein